MVKISLYFTIIDRVIQGAECHFSEPEIVGETSKKGLKHVFMQIIVINSVSNLPAPLKPVYP